MCHTLICNHSQKWYQISPCIIHILMVKLISPHLNFLPLASSTSVTTYGTNREAGNFSSPRVETCTYVKWGILWKQMKSSKGSRVFSFNYKTIGTRQFDLQRKCSKLLQSWRLANLEELQLSRSKKTPQKPLKTPVFNTLPAHAETYASLKKCQRTTPIHLLIEAASNENQTGKKMNQSLSLIQSISVWLSHVKTACCLHDVSSDSCKTEPQLQANCLVVVLRSMLHPMVSVGQSGKISFTSTKTQRSRNR